MKTVTATEASCEGKRKSERREGRRIDTMTQQHVLFPVFVHTYYALPAATGRRWKHRDKAVSQLWELYFKAKLTKSRKRIIQELYITGLVLSAIATSVFSIHTLV